MIFLLIMNWVGKGLIIPTYIIERYLARYVPTYIIPAYVVKHQTIICLVSIPTYVPTKYMFIVYPTYSIS